MTTQLKELSYQDVRSNHDWQFLRKKDRVNQLRHPGTRYAGVQGSTVVFRTPSSEYDKNGIVYRQFIRLLDLPESLKLENTPLREKVRIAMNGDVALRCECPSFSYHGFAYILTQLDAGDEGPIKYARPNEVPETRFPGIRNPGLRDNVCKHLALVLEVFGGHWPSVVHDLRAQGYA